MEKLLLDETVLSKLREVKEHVEVCDLEGRIVGYFKPSIYAGYIMPPDPTEEELAESEEGPEYTLAEVWERIHRGETS